MTFASITDATAWLRDHQDDRAVPTKLHFIDTENQGELGSPRFTPAFLRYLYARSNDVNPEAQESVICPDTSWNCPTCGGLGSYDVLRERYRYPMWRAIVRLRNERDQWTELSRRDRRFASPGRPVPSVCVAAIFEARYDWEEALRLLHLNRDAGEALLLMAVRQLFGLYELGPVPRAPRFTELSESQQRALVDGAA